MGQQKLQQQLLKLAPKAWYQKPPSNQVSYPCFIYKSIEPNTVRADNKVYLLMPKYEVLYITPVENDGIWQKMTDLFEYCSIGRKYVSDNLYYYPFTINFK